MTWWAHCFVPITSLTQSKAGFISMQNLPDFLNRNIDARFDKKTDFTAEKLKNIHLSLPFLVHLFTAAVSAVAVATRISESRYFCYRCLSDESDCWCRKILIWFIY